MAKGDREFLKAYANAAPRQDDESVEEYARRIGADPGPSTPDAPTEPEQPAAPKAEETPPSDEPKAPKPAPKPGGKAPKSLAGKAANAAADKVTGVQNWIAGAPTPGGIGVLLLIILLFVAIIVPVSGGYTRLQLFWLTLLGRTSLPDASGNVPQTGVSDSTSSSSSSSASSSASSGTAGTGGVSRGAVALPAPVLPAGKFPIAMPGSSRPRMPGAR